MLRSERGRTRRHAPERRVVDIRHAGAAETCTSSPATAAHAAAAAAMRCRHGRAGVVVWVHAVLGVGGV